MLMRRIFRYFGILVALMISLPLSSCGSRQKIELADDALISMGDSTLTKSYVLSRIPVGIDAQDSIALFHKIVDNWVETMVLGDFAQRKLPEIEGIERQVENYRNRLIVSTYLKKMTERKQISVDSDSIKSFYQAHKSEMITETPLVKGIYLKVSDSAPGLEGMKRCVFEASDKSIDELETKWASDAIQYDYFVEEWVDWDIIADEIPYRFYDPDAFLTSTSDFETSCNGMTYLLHITEYLPSGSLAPYEFASKRIGAIMQQQKMAEYEDALVRALVKKAIDDEQLVAIGYDPLSRKTMVNQSQTQSENKINENEK